MDRVDPFLHPVYCRRRGVSKDPGFSFHSLSLFSVFNQVGKVSNVYMLQVSFIPLKKDTHPCNSQTQHWHSPLWNAPVKLKTLILMNCNDHVYTIDPTNLGRRRLSTTLLNSSLI